MDDSMVSIILIILFSALVFFAVWSACIAPYLNKHQKNDNKIIYFAVTMGATFALRLLFSVIFKGHEQDMQCFNSWSLDVFEKGFANFYADGSTFHDYPPGYMYVLYIIGAIRRVIPFADGALRLLLKLPAVICDMLIGYIIYRVASKKYSSVISTLFSALWLLNPAVIINSAVWGQVDSVYTLFAVLMLYFITERKLIISYFMFAACLFIKPQAFILTPVLIGAFAEQVLFTDFSWEKLIKNIGYGLGAIAAVFILALPFGLGNVIEQYKATIASYPYQTVNAFNFWGALGKNWAGLIGISNVLSVIFLASISIYAVYLVLKSKNESKYYFAGAVLVFLTYMLSTRMHERYAYPAIALMLLAVVCVADRRTFGLFSAISLSQFFNTAWVLFVYSTDIQKYFRSNTVLAASWINLALTAAVLYFGSKAYLGINPLQAPKNTKSKNKNGKERAAVPATDNEECFFPKIKRFDIIAMAAITVIYSGIALYDLGDNHAAETEYLIPASGVTIDLGQDYDISNVQYFVGPYEFNSGRKLTITAQNSSGAQTYTHTIENGSVFRWEEEGIDRSARYIILTAPYSSQNNELSIKEVGIRSADDGLIEPVSVSESGAWVLFDEQNEVPERSDFRNSTYFDEIYHARTGYEFIHSMPVYEWTHPPLGKVFIALGIKLFGMNPFGWRIMGTLFGILMVPLIYLFALKFLKKSWLAVVSCLLLTFDFMHFAQSRIATIDVYITFFTILMFYFIYRYSELDIKKTSLVREFMWLGLCGVSCGFAIASKWTGFYAGAGVFTVWLYTIIKRGIEYYKYEKSKNKPQNSTRDFGRFGTLKYVLSTLAVCCVFFGIIPVLIYYLSYIPYLKAPNSHGILTILKNQTDMYTYHSKTVLSSTHAYSSHWYEWILMKRPIWYFTSTISDGVKEGISSFGNPLVWWAGVPAFFYMLYRIIFRKDKRAAFLAVTYFWLLIGWVPVTRITFIYHYFPCVPFVVLMIGYSLKCLYDGAKNKKRAMYLIFAYTAAVIVLFVMFYPVLSGQPCSVDYAKNYLKWFDSWVLL